MLSAGPSKTAMSSAWHSSPKTSPSMRKRSRSKEQAVKQPLGKLTALMLSLTPRWSPFWSCLRSPVGPSLTIMFGTPKRLTAFVRQKSKPEQSPAFSSKVIWEINCFMLVFINYNFSAEFVGKQEIVCVVFCALYVDFDMQGAEKSSAKTKSKRCG